MKEGAVMNHLDQTRTPLFDALKEYVNRDTLPFHVPGHKKESEWMMNLKTLLVRILLK